MEAGITATPALLTSLSASAGYLQPFLPPPPFLPVATYLNFLNFKMSSSEEEIFNESGEASKAVNADTDVEGGTPPPSKDTDMVDSGGDDKEQGSDDCKNTSMDMDVDGEDDRRESAREDEDGDSTEDKMNGNDKAVSQMNGTNHNSMSNHSSKPPDQGTAKTINNIEQKNGGNDKTTMKNENGGTQKHTTMGNGSATASSATTTPAVPVLRGTLSYINNELTRKHVIQGKWNFEPSTEHAPQNFQLVRTLGLDEDPTELPKDGTFDGSFSLAYVHISAKGKKKEKSRVIQESGVKIKFTEREGEDDAYDVHGEGTNQYGVFSVIGTAVRDLNGPEKKYKVKLRKRYLNSPTPAAESPEKKIKSKSKKRKLEKSGGSGSAYAQAADEPLPDPSPSHASNVVCLRGEITPSSSAQDGVVHRVSGMWSSGLDVILEDPNIELGLCNQFEYEYRGTVATEAFPISGKYTGWFNLTGEDGTRNRIPERDVTLKFKKNNAGFYNVEGRGTNMFGKYNITGTLNKDNVITIFRHFQPIKAKKTPLPAKIKAPVIANIPDSERLTLDDVDSPESEILDVITTPEDGQYAALSRGILKVNEDGVISCTGKWAMSKSHHANNISANFHFGLEEHHAKGESGSTTFPVDSSNYKGSFKMKRGTTKFQSVVDRQIVMKFRKNNTGSHNVYGKGINSFGTFNLIGTLISHGPHSGYVELFRIYDTQDAAPEPEPQPSKQTGKVLPTAKNITKKGSSSKAAPAFTSLTPPGPAMRRESSRATKLPSRLEEGDPQAHNSRLMEKCSAVLKVTREKDLLGGSFFAEPVDPVAHGIPTYHQIITNPMDLGTIQAKMDADEIESPEEFARLMRLIFENAIKFNIDPGHIVHQAAKNLFTLFNNKFSDVERMMDTKKPTKKELKELKKKQQEEHKVLEKENKRKREEEADPTLRMARLMYTSGAEVTKHLVALKSASASTVRSGVTRDEFNLQCTILENLSTQVLQLQDLIATLIPAAAKARTAIVQDALPAVPLEATMAKKPTKKRKQTKPEKSTPAPVAFVVAAPVPAPAPPKPAVEKKLSLEEQQELTDAINIMAQTDDDRLESIINIIRETANLNEDEEEIDLEIDALSAATQRQLLNFVNMVSTSMHHFICICIWDKRAQ